jgi:hypothetical protein
MGSDPRKVGKAHGQVIERTPEEIIGEVGHPSTWAAQKRAMYMRELLAPGATTLDIEGIRGIGSRRGYLMYLYDHLDSPPGVGTVLVSREEDNAICKQVMEDTRREIVLNEALLEKLERTAVEVKKYLDKLKVYRDEIRKQPKHDPERLTEELAREWNAADELMLKKVSQEVQDYYEKWVELSGQTRVVDK